MASIPLNSLHWVKNHLLFFFVLNVVPTSDLTVPPLPSSPALHRSFIERYYIIVPSSLLGWQVLACWIISHLGANSHLVALQWTFSNNNASFLRWGTEQLTVRKVWKNHGFMQYISFSHCVFQSSQIFLSSVALWLKLLYQAFVSPPSFNFHVHIATKQSPQNTAPKLLIILFIKTWPKIQNK